MTVRTVIQSLTGAVLALSATRPPVFDAAGYSDTTIVWSTIGQVESFGAHGRTTQEITFTAIADGIVQKLKGSANFGNKTFSLGHVPGDAGQALLKTASQSQNRYSARVTYPLGDGEVTNEIHYMDVLVMSREFQDGDANTVRKVAVGFGLCREQVEVAAT